MRATVLVADDDETVRDCISWVLGGDGFQVLTAADGAEAVRRSAKADVDLFILDVHMPILDGAATLAELRGKRRFRDTPILFLTGEPHDAPAGALALAKPCSVGELLGAVRSLLLMKAATRRTTESAADRRRARPRSSAGPGASNRSSAAARR
jgi:DNA-binding response OmpR family regulator